MDEKSAPQNEQLKQLETFADEAKALSKETHRRHLEVRAGFYEKLAALDAGSIALVVSVGIAFVGRSESASAPLHARLGWLVAIAFFLWLSLLFSIAHNLIYVTSTRLEAEVAQESSNIHRLLRGVLTAHLSGSEQSIKVMDDLIKQSFGKRLEITTKKTFRLLSVNRVLFIGYVATASFLIAYTLAFTWFMRIWWLTR
jgi:hypothetical protein